MERQISPACRAGNAELPSTDEGRSVVGLRRVDGVSGRCADGALGHLDAGAVSRCAGAERGDTGCAAVAAQILIDASDGWDNWRRNVDYYPEGELIWLEVDTLIRKQSKGKKSINDFCARFHGLGGDTTPKVVPYTFDDVVENLNAVVPYDWATFLHERLTTKQ